MGARENGRRASNAARAAWLYYLEEKTQGEIAGELGVSRSTAVRLLRWAKETGMVKISLDVPHAAFAKERELEGRFGLKKVRLVPEAGDGETLKHWLGYAAAGLLEEFVVPGSTVVVTWGTTLRAMASALGGVRPVEGVQIVAPYGGLNRASGGSNPYGIATQLGRRFGARVRALHAPAFVDDRSAAGVLMRSREIREILDGARGADLAVYSVGTLDDGATMVRLGYLSEAERGALRGRGAVGDIACHWIDADGQPVEAPGTINTIGIPLKDFGTIPQKLAVAGGKNKREALLAALRGGYVSALVTDEPTAGYLLEKA